MPKRKQNHPHLRGKNGTGDLDAYLSEFNSSSNPITNLFYSENHLSTWASRHAGKKLSWKILAWFFLLINLLSIFVHRNPLTVKDLYALAYVPGIIGLLAYAYDRRFLPETFWKVYFPIFITVNLYDLFREIIERPDNIAEFWFVFIVSIALIYLVCLGIYNYAFRANISPASPRKSS